MTLSKNGSQKECQHRYDWTGEYRKGSNDFTEYELICHKCNEVIWS